MKNRQILVIDDDLEIWKTYEAILAPWDAAAESSLGQIVHLLSPDKDMRSEPRLDFQLRFAASGEEGFRLAREARAANRPFAVAFIDIRMPPGWDGMETAVRIRAIDPHMEIVIVTAFSDRSRGEIVQTVGAPDKLLFLRKPFDPEEITQMALSLTEKWNTEKALRDSEARFRALVETTSDWVWEMDIKGFFTYCSPVCEMIYGFRPEELSFRCLFDVLMPPDEAARFRRTFDQCVRQALPFLGVERRSIAKDGTTVHIEASGTPVLSEDGRVIGFRGIDRDITERKKAEQEKLRVEEQYRQSQKMEALGTLAGGIAHDLNNVLTPIMGNAQLCLLTIAPENPLYSKLQNIVKSTEKAARLLRQILAFSRKQVMARKPLNLNTLINDFGKMLRRLIREDIALELDLADDLGNVNVDAGQIEQLIMNLVVNARDAVAEGGKILIRTRNTKVGAEQLFDVDHKPLAGNYVVMSVIDNGIGIDPQNMARIFDPFFTTKPAGKGTGLGLSTVYGIVKQHDGHILIDTGPDRGANFQIFLRHCEDATRDDRELANLLPVQGGNETILVAEDNPEVRQMVVSILEHYGYRVFSAASGSEALQIFYAPPHAIDLVVSDIVMPGVGGRTLADTIRKEHPYLPIIFMSGYPADVNLDDLGGKATFRYLQKPFNPQEIAEAVRGLLDSVAAAGPGRT